MKSSDRKTKTREPAAVPVPVQNTAVDLTSASASPVLPHERDESVGMTGGLQSGVVQQASRDLKRGLEDTSRAPEADRAYRKQQK